MSSSESSESEPQPPPKKGSKKKNDATAASANCQWLPLHDSELISTLEDQKLVGNQSENGWKDSVWTVCAERQAEKFPDAPGGPKTAPKCSDHYTNLKGDFKIVDELAHKSGMGWNDATNMVTAQSDDVWERMVKANPKFKKWRKKSFPLYHRMQELTGQSTARGDQILVLAKKDKAKKKQDTKTKAAKEVAAPVKADADDDVADTGSTADKAKDTKAAKRSRSRSRAVSSEVDTINVDSDDSSEDEKPAKKKLARETARRRKSTGAEAIHDVAGGIHAMSSAFEKAFGASSSSGEDKADERRIAAIVEVSALAQFTAAERGTLVRLFSDDKLVACYMAIPVPDVKETFLRGLLSDKV